MHSPRTGTYWSTSLLFSLVQDLVDLIDDQNTLDGISSQHSKPHHFIYLFMALDAQARQVVQTYNMFVDRVLELDLVKSIEEPPRLNVSSSFKLRRSQTA
jgi:tRNA nucleotidyltransferase (CCA-adding enzyme)